MILSGIALASRGLTRGNVRQISLGIAVASHGLDGLTALPMKISGNIGRISERCSSSISKCVNTLMFFGHPTLNPSRVSVQNLGFRATFARGLRSGKATALPIASGANACRFHNSQKQSSKCSSAKATTMLLSTLSTNKKATRYESPYQPYEPGLLSLLLERWPFGVEMIIPFYSHLAMLKHVLTFDEVQPLCNVVRDLRLQFAGESPQSMHFWAGEKSHVLQFLDVMRECVKVLIDTGKSLIGFELSRRMVSSQVASMKGDLVRGASLLTQWRVSFCFIGEGQAKEQEKNCGKPHGYWFLCRSESLCAEGSLYAKP